MAGPSPPWRRALIFCHRWLGIAGSLLFISWFASGVVLMYAGMPALDAADRLRRLPPLDLSDAAVGVGEAAVTVGFTPRRIVVGMLGERPVYRLAGSGEWATIFADNGTPLDGLSRGQAMEVARRFAPEHADTASYDRRMVEPDQWTLQSRVFFPLHRIALNDAAGTVLYVSEPTAEPVMRTTSAGRRWAYLGAVLHWLYFTPLRANAGLWNDVVIWLSILGCLLCLSGLIVGLVTLGTRGRRFASPYSGLMRWHHYTGLAFGLVTFTWAFSGALSMEPWSWHPGTAPRASQANAVAGGLPRLGVLTPSHLQAGLEALVPSFHPREIDVLQFLGVPYGLALDPGPEGEMPGLPNTLAPLGERGPRQRLVALDGREPYAFERFEADAFSALPEAVMPGVRILDRSWLRGYDSYYYDRDGARRLPVLRVRYDDPQETWLYFDPYRGAIVRKEERLTRINRWLYHGLHSLDFPFLYGRRPLWDVVVIVLSLGGIAVSVTSIGQGWRRLRRHATRLMGR